MTRFAITARDSTPPPSRTGLDSILPMPFPFPLRSQFAALQHFHHPSDSTPRRILTCRPRIDGMELRTRDRLCVAAACRAGGRRKVGWADGRLAPLSVFRFFFDISFERLPCPALASYSNLYDTLETARRLLLAYHFHSSYSSPLQVTPAFLLSKDVNAQGLLQ